MLHDNSWTMVIMLTANNLAILLQTLFVVHSVKIVLPNVGLFYFSNRKTAGLVGINNKTWHDCLPNQQGQMVIQPAHELYNPPLSSLL